MLLDVDEVVTYLNLVLVESSALVAHDEESVTSERMFLDRFSTLDDLDATDGDVVVSAMLSNFLQLLEMSEISLCCCSL